jgi:DNA repair exonuclease SbcCD ATPase subunit
VVKDEINKALAKLSKDRATQEYLSEKLSNEEKSLISLKRNADDLLEVRSLFQKAAQDTQQKLEFHISNLVSTALAAIWDDPYTFQLEFVQKRNKTEAELWFIRNGEKMKPIDASGGGAVDIASFALRTAFWSLTKKTRPLFVIDEPFRNLSSDLQSRALDMLQMLSKNLGLQLIIVSHIDQLILNADKEFKVSLNRGRSEVK